MVFGNENAENDELLEECSIEEQVTGKQIYVGRWGVGKTAVLLLTHRKLANTLKSLGKDDRAWYIEESSLDVKALVEFQKNFSGNETLFTKALEDIWRAEIIRRAAQLLVDLSEFYGCPREEHWKYIGLAVKGWRTKPIWKHIPEVMTVIFGNNNRTDALTEIQLSLERLFQNEVFDNIQKCLNDIKDTDVLPGIAIEPIDSPQSSLDKQSQLALPLVTSLLNVYKKYFQPSSRQLLSVKLSIPWHLYNTKRLESPQKINQYIEQIKWDERKLREFINRRIGWEFKRVGRRSQHQDEWTELFAATIDNDQCKPIVQENSFQYVLRHTHYRARDLQRITRRAVELCASMKKVTEDDILLGKTISKIEPDIIKEAVREVSYSMAEELIIESSRLLGDLATIIPVIRGLNVPFSPVDFQKRLRQIYQDVENFNPALLTLWEAGIIGVLITVTKSNLIEQVRAKLEDNGHRQYNTSSKIIHTWSLFAYNWQENINNVITFFEQSDGIEVQFIFHPITFKHLSARVNYICPIGS
jgi:hypothetical protein